MADGAHPVGAIGVRFGSCAAVVVAAAMALLFAVEGGGGLDLADEGYLWYGVQRVLEGEVPIRDFLAYDPGRYYWTAAGMRALGDGGVLALRATTMAFQGIGLLVGIVLLRRALPAASWPFFVLAGITLLVWMVPRHKVFDITVAIVLIAMLARLIARPTAARYFLMGLAVGAAAVFGRNHGVYGAVASLAAMGVLAWQARGEALPRAFPAFAGGVAIGFLPVLAAATFMPGFFDAFVKDVLAIFAYGGTNLALPVPWPTIVPGMPLLDQVPLLLTGCFFVAVLVFAIVGPLYVVTRRLTPPNATFAAAALLALPYAHFAFSRADVSHLAQGIFPLLIGLMAAPAINERTRLVLVAGLLAASLVVVAPKHPAWAAWRDGDWRNVTVAGDRLTVAPGTAADFERLEALVAKHAPEGRPFVVTPLWPGAYAAFGRKAPVYDTYGLFPRSAAFQEAEIARLRAADPGFVAVLDTALDGIEARRFRNTHPRVYRYIIENFTLAAESRDPLSVYVPR